MTFEQIKELIQMVNQSEFRSFEINSDGTMLRLSKNQDSLLSMGKVEPASKVNLTGAEESSQIMKETTMVVPTTVTKEEVPAGNIVKSPIVGTFYQSSAPGNPDFVKIGDRVKKGDVLCIVEAMKVMNEVISEFDGEVKAVLAENESLVEYGQPLFVIG